MTEVFIVIKTGVYRHDIRGVTTTIERAIKFARECAKTDRDSYHSYDVIAREVDKLDMTSEDKIIYSVDKDKVSVEPDGPDYEPDDDEGRGYN